MKRYHRKKRNSALLMEFLVRHISECLINDNKKEADKAMLVSKRFFSKKSELYKELRLFRAILDTRVKSRDSAQKIISEVVGLSRKVNARKLDAEKSKLIKEINYNFGGDKFFSHKVPDYTVYASVHSLLAEARNKKNILSPIDRIKLEDTVVEHLVTAKRKLPAAKLKKNPDYSNSVYKFVVERFHAKYEGKLTEQQRKFLTNYAVYLISEDKQTMSKCILTEVSVLKGKLREVKDSTVQADPDVSARLTECYKKLVTTNFDNVTESNILDILQYMKLTDEVES